MSSTPAIRRIRILKTLRVVAGAEATVDNPVAAVGHIDSPVGLQPGRGLCSRRFKPGLSVLESKATDFDRQGHRGPQTCNALLRRDDRDLPPGGGHHDLLTEQGRSPPLDHPELGIDLVGPIQIEVEERDFIELRSRNPEGVG